jgi:hypothetical protein
MIKDKKLASPIKCINFTGDNNDDIPLQMTEEQPANNTQTCPGGQLNTMITDYWVQSGPSDMVTQKQIKSL